MENKYYTPQIEEFRAGFEYIFKHENGDVLCVYGGDGPWDWDTLDEIKDCLNRDLIKIKLLDSEDIESLGFSNYIPPHEYDHTWSKDNYELKCWFNKELPIVRILEYGIIIFHCNIKNKSELKVLLNQLGIK